MICPRCGQESSGKYCSSCGALLDSDSQEIDHLDNTENSGNAGSRKKGRSRRSRRKKRSGRIALKPGKLAAGGVIRVLVLASRLMQIASFALMAGMTVWLAAAFWRGRTGLGSVRTIAAERNYGLAAYLAVGGAMLLMGAIWSLWILSKKEVGGETRLKLYDTGRGLVPFLLCAAVFWLSAYGSELLPAEAEAWRGISGGLNMALAIVVSCRHALLVCSGAGAGLSLARKIIRV